ncbi:MAG: GSU2403 family nucleotidyltransferase fold protein [Vulcanimicrobiota bacterium]
MSEQSELVYRIIEMLDSEGILHNVIVVGSWCIYFYRQHYKEADTLPPLRTRDIEFDVSPLRNFPHKVDIIDLFNKLGFVLDLKGSGFTNLAHPELMIEFLIPEKGRGTDDPIDLKGYGINAQPIRYLSLLEDKLITVNHRGHMVTVPHSAWFSIHKLIISQRRPASQKNKTENDMKQAIAVWNMIAGMGEQKIIQNLLNNIPGRWLKLVKKALGKADQLERLESIMENK